MNKYISVILSLFMLPLMHSCIMTSDYDLDKDIDGTVCFTPDGFTIGGDNSAVIPLDHIIKLKQNGQLTTDEEGNYLFYKNGDDMEPTEVIVGQGSLCDAYEMTKSLAFASASLEPMTRYPGYSTLTLQSDIPLDAHPDRQGESVRELLYIYSSMPVVIQTRFSGDIADFCNSITMTYQLPSFYIVADESELTETIKVSDFDKVHEHVINVVGVDFTKTGLRPGERIGINHPSGEMYMEGSIKVSGKTFVSNSRYNDALKNNPAMNVHVLVNTLGTTRVKGRFNSKKDIDIEPITFNDLPDIIQDEEIVIDLDNPVVRLSLDNEVPANVFLNASMKGVKQGKYISCVQAGDEYGTDPIAFAGAPDESSSSKTNVWISRKPLLLPDSVSSNVVVSDMNNLVRTVPDRVEIAASARTDSSQIVTLALGKEYMATPRYELIAPLKTGPEMKIVYTKNVTGLNEQLANMQLDGLLFTADFTNNLPLDLHAVVNPLDANGKVISDLTVSTADIIPANSTKGVVYTVSADNPTSVQRIHTLQVKLYAESSAKIAGQYLNKDQDVKISHAKVTLKGAKYNINGK